VPFSPLGRGFLTGTVSASTDFSEGDIRAGLPRFTVEARQANQAVVDLVQRVAEAKGATPGQWRRPAPAPRTPPDDHQASVRH
jgi:aryl-alcohol dehydrogenase-like predicted oxidoreductase